MVCGAVLNCFVYRSHHRSGRFQFHAATRSMFSNAGNSATQREDWRRPRTEVTLNEPDVAPIEPEVAPNTTSAFLESLMLFIDPK